MYPLTIECYVKPDGAEKSQEAGLVRFHINEEDHQRMEKVEETLQESGQVETMMDVNLADLDIELPDSVGELNDCQIRVYINREDHRGHFHLVGHRKADGSLFYSNAVMVDVVGA